MKDTTINSYTVGVDNDQIATMLFLDSTIFEPIKRIIYLIDNRNLVTIDMKWLGEKLLHYVEIAANTINIHITRIRKSIFAVQNDYNLDKIKSYFVVLLKYFTKFYS